MARSKNSTPKALKSKSVSNNPSPAKTALLKSAGLYPAASSTSSSSAAAGTNAVAAGKNGSPLRSHSKSRRQLQRSKASADNTNTTTTEDVIMSPAPAPTTTTETKEDPFCSPVTVSKFLASHESTETQGTPDTVVAKAAEADVDGSFASPNAKNATMNSSATPCKSNVSSNVTTASTFAVPMGGSVANSSAQTPLTNNHVASNPTTANNRPHNSFITSTPKDKSSRKSMGGAFKSPQTFTRQLHSATPSSAVSSPLQPLASPSARPLVTTDHDEEIAVNEDQMLVVDGPGGEEEEGQGDSDSDSSRQQRQLLQQRLAQQHQHHHRHTHTHTHTHGHPHHCATQKTLFSPAYKTSIVTKIQETISNVKSYIYPSAQTDDISKNEEGNSVSSCAECQALAAAEGKVALPYVYEEDPSMDVDQIDEYQQQLVVLNKIEEVVGDEEEQEEEDNIYYETLPEDLGEVEDEEEDDDDGYGYDPYCWVYSVPRIDTHWEQYALPPKTRSSPRITLVLDLDETLVHCTTNDDSSRAFDVEFDVEFRGYMNRVKGLIRPNLQHFLEECSKMFEVVVFTASLSIYANVILDLLDPEKKYIKHRLFRDHCVNVNDVFVKDLRILGRDLNKVIIIDNALQAFAYQIENGIFIKSWYEDTQDTELLKHLDFLRKIKDCDDVRPALEKEYGLRNEMIKRAKSRNLIRG